MIRDPRQNPRPGDIIVKHGHTYEVTAIYPRANRIVFTSNGRLCADGLAPGLFRELVSGGVVKVNADLGSAEAV